MLRNSYHTGKDSIFSRPSSYIVPKGSPLQVEMMEILYLLFIKHNYVVLAYLIQDKLRHTIMWLRDTGILEKVKYDVMNPPHLIPDPIVRFNQPLILKQLGIIMILLVAGLSIGTLLFLVELFKRPKLNNTSETVNGATMTTTSLKEALEIIDSDSPAEPQRAPK